MCSADGSGGGGHRFVDQIDMDVVAVAAHGLEQLPGVFGFAGVYGQAEVLGHVERVAAMQPVPDPEQDRRRRQPQVFIRRAEDPVKHVHAGHVEREGQDRDGGKPGERALEMLPRHMEVEERVEREGEQHAGEECRTAGGGAGPAGRQDEAEQGQLEQDRDQADDREAGEVAVAVQKVRQAAVVKAVHQPAAERGQRRLSSGIRASRHVGILAVTSSLNGARSVHS
jgi:hypothetical protein